MLVVPRQSVNHIPNQLRAQSAGGPSQAYGPLAISILPLPPPPACPEQVTDVGRVGSIQLSPRRRDLRHEIVVSGLATRQGFPGTQTVRLCQDEIGRPLVTGAGWRRRSRRGEGLRNRR